MALLSFIVVVLTFMSAAGQRQESGTGARRHVQLVVGCRACRRLHRSLVNGPDKATNDGRVEALHCTGAVFDDLRFLADLLKELSAIHILAFATRDAQNRPFVWFCSAAQSGVARSECAITINKTVSANLEAPYRT